MSLDTNQHAPSASSPAAAHTGSAVTPAPSSGTPAEKPKKQARGSAKERIEAEIAKLQEQERARQQKFADKVARLEREAVPLKDRKNRAFDLLESLRSRVRFNADVPRASDADIDAMIEQVVKASYPLAADSNPTPSADDAGGAAVPASTSSAPAEPVLS